MRCPSLSPCAYECVQIFKWNCLLFLLLIQWEPKAQTPHFAQKIDNRTKKDGEREKSLRKKNTHSFCWLFVERWTLKSILAGWFNGESISNKSKETTNSSLTQSLSLFFVGIATQSAQKPARGGIFRTYTKHNKKSTRKKKEELNFKSALLRIIMSRHEGMCDSRLLLLFICCGCDGGGGCFEHH